MCKMISDIPRYCSKQRKCLAAILGSTFFVEASRICLFETAVSFESNILSTYHARYITGTCVFSNRKRMDSERISEGQAEDVWS
jgi:hypothetical protein